MASLAELLKKGVLIETAKADFNRLFQELVGGR